MARTSPPVPFHTLLLTWERGTPGTAGPTRHTATLPRPHLNSLSVPTPRTRARGGEESSVPLQAVHTLPSHGEGEQGSYVVAATNLHHHCCCCCTPHCFPAAGHTCSSTGCSCSPPISSPWSHTCNWPWESGTGNWSHGVVAATACEPHPNQSGCPAGVYVAYRGALLPLLPGPAPGSKHRETLTPLHS